MKNYDKLDVHFDLWKKESDAQPYIPDMVEKMKADGLAYLSEGALVVDVTEEGDKKELPDVQNKTKRSPLRNNPKW